MKLHIKDIKCWKCGGDMSIALMMDEVRVEDPSEFSDDIIALAQANGVALSSKFSNTLEESYVANVCPHCDAMTGKFFLHEYWYDPDRIVLELPS